MDKNQEQPRKMMQIMQGCELSSNYMIKLLIRESS
jgi:hypothetical protein